MEMNDKSKALTVRQNSQIARYSRNLVVRGLELAKWIQSTLEAQAKQLNQLIDTIDHCWDYNDWETLILTAKQIIKIGAVEKCDFDLYYHLGLSYETLDRWDEAIKLYKNVIETEPKTYYALAGLGRAYLEIGSYQEAIKELKKARELHPKCEVEIFMLGYAYQLLDCYNEAIEAYQRAIELGPKHPRTHFQLGLCYCKTRRITEAMAEYQWLKIFVENEEWYENLEDELNELWEAIQKAK